METLKLIDLLNKYGFATIAAVGMGWFIHFIYKYVTTEIMKKLGEMNVVLIALIDRVRMLDNDLIRLKSKLETVLEIKENKDEFCGVDDTKENTKKTPSKK
tara:strand:+ start:421 stop:723 length:303 start_codon:yes stop_codon:yes gene_type:complete